MNDQEAIEFNRTLESMGERLVAVRLGEVGGFRAVEMPVAEAWLREREEGRQKQLMRGTTIAAWIAAGAGTVGLVITTLAYFFPR